MATMKLALLAAACACAYAFPQEPTGPLGRSTIFADEKFEGEIFENLDAMEEMELSRNTDSSSIYRLPNTTRPVHYNVLWQISITNTSRLMSGATSMEICATQENVTEIVLHADQMTLGSLTLAQGTINAPTGNVPIAGYTLEGQTQFLRIHLNSPLLYNSQTPVYYTLSVQFSAPLRTDMYGIYESWYRNNPENQNEAVRWMASTQFQATAARYAFPCYDEPSFKATFDITIRRPTAYSSWSCTRQQETRNSTFAGFQEDVYTRTPVMSTYLLALIVAEYQRRADSTNVTLIDYEVIARPGAMSNNQGDYAYDVGIALLSNMSDHTAMDFYGVNSNLKMTQAAIPDFSAGAMENWGLLTYREAYLMYDEAHTNGYFKQMIAYILSHEIAHMWFGNLVTCDWWDVLWLNEGFARYYQYFLTHSVEEYMGLATRFITEQIHTSMLSDSANNPHALSTTGIGSNTSVSGMFSTLTYNKGAAVIRMTEHLLGYDVHREGLRKYLADNQFKTALPIDLFEALESVAIERGAISQYGSDFSFVDYYNSWTEQAGHPVLNVQVNHQTGEMIIYQRRFNINTGYAITNNRNYVVPITFATASNPDFTNTKPTHVISNAVTSISRGSVGDEWVVFNKQQTGFYRVNYDDYTWDLIVMQLRGPNRTQIHEYNRAQIVNDVFQFARSGLMSYTKAFSILSFLENETEYAPWLAAITGFNWVRNRLAASPYLADVEALIIRWSTNVIQQLTYNQDPNEDFMVSYLRYQLAPVLCAIDAPGCRSNATAQFRALPQQEVSVDNRNWVYCNAIRVGTAADFTILWNRFLTHNVYTEKIQLLFVLGCTSNAQSLETFLNAIITDNHIIRPQDYTNAFSGAVNGNEENTQIVFQYIQNNLAAVTRAFGSPVTPLSYISARLRSETEILAFQTWVNASQAQLGSSYQSVYNGAQNSRDNLRWAAEVQADLNNYFTTGDLPVAMSTAAPTTVVAATTVQPPALVQPVTPNLPEPTDAAATTYLSMLIIALAVIVNALV